MHEGSPVRLVVGDESEAYGRVALGSRHSGRERIIPVTSLEAERTITEALRHLGIPFETEKIGAGPSSVSVSLHDSDVRDTLRRIYEAVPGAVFVAPSSLRADDPRSSVERKGVL